MSRRKKIGIILIAWGIVFAYSYVHVMSQQRVTTTLELPDKRTGHIKAWGNKKFTKADEHCLALNVYFEARGEKSKRGKYAVADVVMYRYMNASYPNAVCDIVQQGRYYSWNEDRPVRGKCQFSWWCDGREDIPKNTEAFEEAIDIANEVLHNPNYVPKVEYAIFYHSGSVRPRWARTKEFVEQIGNHRFYR